MTPALSEEDDQSNGVPRWQEALMICTITVLTMAWVPLLAYFNG